MRAMAVMCYELSKATEMITHSEVMKALTKPGIQLNHFTNREHKNPVRY